MERPPVKAVSQCIVKDAKLEWIVNNFRCIQGQKGTFIKSPEYQIDIAGDCTKWKIKLYPYGFSVEGAVAVYLELVDTKLDDLVVLCDVFLLNIQGKPIARKKFGKPRPYSKGKRWGFPRMIGRDVLLRNISDHDNANLTIIASVKVSHCAEQFCCSSMTLQSSILDDLAKFRQDADYSDVLITVCGSEFQAHKAILAARSTVFSSMFKHNMKEANSGKIEIEDMTPEAFEEFLKFIYTGDANIYNYASELFAAADKYDVQDLKAFCEEELEYTINGENCIKTLVLSDLHSSTRLKEKAMNFIVSKSLKFDKNKFAEIKNPSLMLEVIEAFMNHKI